MHKVASLVLAVLLTACASKQSPPEMTAGSPAPSASSTAAAPATGNARLDRSTISGDAIHQPEFRNAYDAVQRLRPQWLVERPNDRLVGDPSHVLVYVDDVKFGDTESLRQILINNVVSIKFINGRDAFSRWGDKHDRGVIFVSTMHELRKP